MKNARAKKTNVSCVGDDNFKLKLRLLSLKTGRDIGDLVREAIDAQFGNQMDGLDVAFFASVGADMHKKADTH